MVDTEILLLSSVIIINVTNFAKYIFNNAYFLSFSATLLYKAYVHIL